jgi:hypothetical protein
VNIDWVIPCRFVEVHDNLATIVGGGIDTFWAAELPTRLQVILAVRILAMADEVGDPDVKHTVANKIRSPQGEIIGEGTLEIGVGGESARPEFLIGLSLPIVITFEAAQEGTYAVELAIDQSEKSLPIHVVHGLPPGSEPG